MRKQVPPEKTKDVLDFATKKPSERLNSIEAAREAGSFYILFVDSSVALGTCIWPIRICSSVWNDCRRSRWPS